jgi:predicted permease
VLRRRRPRADFDAEIEAHLQLEADRLREAGLGEEDARARARRAFGNVTASRERFYESGRVLFADRLAQDVRFAVRLLARTPLLTAAIVCTLALGIGSTAAVYSLVHAVVLRPLAYDRPDELVQVWESGQRAGGESDWVSFPNFRDWRRESGAFEEMAAYRYGFLTVTGPEGTESMLGLETTDRLFEVLGARPLVGRTFLPGEDQPGRENVAVISRSLWQRRFASDPGVARRRVAVDGRSYSIVGVMPASFRFPDVVPSDTFLSIDVWIPVRPSPDLDDRGSHNFWTVARRKPGTSLDHARAEMTRIAAALAEQYPGSNRDLTVSVAPLREHVASAVRPALLLLLGAVGLVLLLTCASVANLLLSKAESRRREMAVRLALGASRGRLVRQALTESLILSLAGATAGIALAHVLVRFVVRVAPGNIPRLQEASIDGPVLLFTVLVSVFASFLFGLAPAVLGARGGVQGALTDTGTRTASAGASRRLVRQSLVAGQVALAVMLLVGAGLLLRSLAEVAGLDPGFRASGVLVAPVNLSSSRYGDPAKQIAFFEESMRRVRALPGVVSAGAANSIPLTGVNDQGGFAVEGRPDPPPGQDGPQANRPRVAAGYFETMGIRLLEGRLFDEHDLPRSRPVAIVSELAAQTYWPGVSPIGKRVAVEWREDGPAWREIVGVVESTRHFGLEAPQKPEVYVPHTQSASPFLALVVRTQGDPSALLPAVRKTIAAIDPDQAVFGSGTMDEVLSQSSARRRFQSAVVAAFAALALLLASIGVYGVVAHAVAQRHREIGVRLALGARPRDVVAMTMNGGVRLAAVGVLLGLLGAVALSRGLGRLLFGVSALDVATYAGVVAVLLCVACLSAYLASRAAACVDPLAALRDE